MAKAARAAFLIDADAYFSAFRHAVERARKSILIVGWDIDSRTPVGHPEGAPPLTLLELLNDTLARRPELQVHALGWDFSFIYTFERERLPAYRFAWSAHPRLVSSWTVPTPSGPRITKKLSWSTTPWRFPEDSTSPFDVGIRRPTTRPIHDGSTRPVGRTRPCTTCR